MQPSPAIRASAVRDSLDNLDAFDAGAREAVLEQVPPASRELILTTPRSDWISIEHDHYTVDAIVERFGRERAIDFWCFSLRHLIDRPLLRNFVSGMVNVLGRDPPIVVGFLVKGWALAYRDLCTPVLSRVDGQPAIRFEDVAPEVQRYSHCFDSWDGTCRGFAHVARVRGEVRFSVAPDAKSAQAVFFWS